MNSATNLYRNLPSKDPSGYSLNLNFLYGNDRRRLFIMVLSGLSILTAGFLSRSGLQTDANDALTVQPPAVVLPVAPVKPKPVVLPSRSEADLAFARSEIARYEDLLASLTERADSEPNPGDKMKATLAQLEERLADSQTAADKLARRPRSAKNTFYREHLRGSLLALQEAGKTAVGVFVDADNQTPAIESQFFKVSRTGQ